MKVSVLIPHWKTGKLSAYTIAQLLKYKGEHELEIFVIMVLFCTFTMSITSNYEII